MPPATGVVTELGHPFVVARWRRLLCQLQGGAGCAGAGACGGAGLGSDLIFEDQLGARNAYADTNAARGGRGALGFQSDIERHAANFSGALIGTEQGYDRLAPHVFGFFGNNLEKTGDAAAGYPWSGGNWTPFPAALALFGPSLLYHVHNLATAAFARDVPNACWALATGARLSIDGAALARAAPPARTFAAGVAHLQAVVASQWTGYALEDYVDLRPGGRAALVGQGATLTILAAPAALAAAPIYAGASPRYFIETNWEDASPRAVAARGSAFSAVLPPRGCVAYGSELDVLGGWFAAYNGRELSGAAPHAVVEDRACAAHGTGAVCVWHAGDDTLLDVLAPRACAPGAAPACAAWDAPRGAAIGAVPCALRAGLVTLAVNASIAGRAVGYFSIACGGELNI